MKDPLDNDFDESNDDEEDSDESESDQSSMMIIKKNKPKNFQFSATYFFMVNLCILTIHLSNYIISSIYTYIYT